MIDFERLMRAYNQRLFRACRAVLRDDAEAEDAAQDAWVQAWRHLDQVEDPDRIGAWLTRIAVREAMARARKRRDTPVGAHEVVPEDTVNTSPPRSPEQAASDRELVHLVEAAIDELPEVYRTVFVLRVVEDMSVAETAEALDIPEPTVKTRLHRARKQVAERILASAGGAARQAFSFQAARCDRMVAAVLRRIG